MASANVTILSGLSQVALNLILHVSQLPVCLLVILGVHLWQLMGKVKARIQLT